MSVVTLLAAYLILVNLISFGAMGLDKYKAKKNYRRTQGHRQPYTKVEITKIKMPTEKAEVKEASAKKATAKKEA